MRRFDKLYNIEKANILLEQRYLIESLSSPFVIPVTNMLPAQTEVVPGRAIDMALGMLNTGRAGGDINTILSSDNYIMDGHHRWAGTTLINPQARVGGAQVSLPADDLLGVLNVATKYVTGRNKSKKGDINNMTPNVVYNILKEKAINGTTIGVLNESGEFSDKREITGENVKYLLGRMPGANGDPLVGADLMSQNVSKINKSLPQWAPSKIDMPHLNSDETTALINRINNGDYRDVSPYSKQAEWLVGK